MPGRAVLYTRVSTDGQTTENQVLGLAAVAEQRGWEIGHIYEDVGISGSKGRDKRPGLDALLKDATRGKFDVVMVWAVDRLGRSLVDLLETLRALDGVKVDLFVREQALDTTTPAGRMMFQMVGVFAEFERSMIVSRVRAGLERARAAGRVGGRRAVAGKKKAEIEAMLREGMGKVKIARLLRTGVGTVGRVAAALGLPE